MLIDGDGMIFHENFLKQGEIGGKQAATLLHTAVYDWALAKIPECPEDVKIVVRVYANLKGLADVCVRSGLVQIPGLIEEFARGFTRSKTMFDFVDVGAGKDRADAKISGTFFCTGHPTIRCISNNRLTSYRNFQAISLRLSLPPGAFRLQP